MPVQVDTPIGVGSPDEWAMWGYAPDKLSAVRTGDGDTSVLYQFSHGRNFIQLFTFSPIVGVTDPVNAASINVSAREYQPGNAERFFYLWWNGARSGSNWGEYIHIFNGDTYGTYSYITGAVTLAAVNGQHGMEMFSVSGTGWEVWVTQVWRVVDFDFGVAAGTSEGGFTHLIGSIVGMIGGNLLLREMPRLNRALGNVKLRPDEYEPAWNAWRNYKHPVWSVRCLP